MKILTRMSHIKLNTLSIFVSNYRRLFNRFIRAKFAEMNFLARLLFVQYQAKHTNQAFTYFVLCGSISQKCLLTFTYSAWGFLFFLASRK